MVQEDEPDLVIQDAGWLPGNSAVDALVEVGVAGIPLLLELKQRWDDEDGGEVVSRYWVLPGRPPAHLGHCIAGRDGSQSEEVANPAIS